MPVSVCIVIDGIRQNVDIKGDSRVGVFYNKVKFPKS